MRPRRASERGVPWESMTANIWREIAHRIDNRNRTALQMTSRTMRQIATPVVAEVTQETRAALCHALKIAYGFRRVLMQFTEAQTKDERFEQAIQRAGDAYAAKVFPTIRTLRGHDSPVDYQLMMKDEDDSGDPTHFLMEDLFIGRVNGMWVQLNVIARRDMILVDVTAGGKESFLARHRFRPIIRVTVNAKGATSGPPPKFNFDPTMSLIGQTWELKRQIGLIDRRLELNAKGGPMARRSYAQYGPNLVARLEKTEQLEKAQRNSKKNIRIEQVQDRIKVAKIAARAIKACVKSLHRGRRPLRELRQFRACRGDVCRFAAWNEKWDP